MIVPNPDIVIKEVDAPCDGWCSSGHHSTGTFKRGGPDSKAEPIRFFKFNGVGKSGIYCEPCLVVMHHMAKLKREGKE